MSNPETPTTNTKSIEPHVASLLAATGASSEFTLEPLQGGRNNRTYRVLTESGDYLLKWYFTHHSDRRDRLGTEFDFCCCLWRHGIRQIPQPLGTDRSTGLGLYEFLAGRPLKGSDVTPKHHHEALAFLRAMNALRSEADAAALPEASEACFSLAGHVARIEQRLQTLAQVVPVDDLDREMVAMLDDRLRPAFVHQRTTLQQHARDHECDLQAVLHVQDRILSPSDFGFHNALLQDDGSLRFVDFEYAGWDDPAKLVGDFFCQIEVPALASSFDTFLDGVAQLTANPELLIQRARWLYPLYQLKWCCIVLNDFLPTGDARRVFSKNRDPDARRAAQLATARRLLERVERMAQ